jgi:hypothetical protein
MSSIKNGKKGSIETMEQINWDEAQDLEYCGNLANEKGTKNGHDCMISRIELNCQVYIDVLDRAIQFLWKQPHELDANALAILSVDGKIELLRKLILARSNEIPLAARLEYLNRFDEDLTRYAEVEKLRDKVIRRYLIESSGTWLRELVDTDDWIVTAWADLDESMSCEHDGYVSVITTWHD